MESVQRYRLRFLKFLRSLRAAEGRVTMGALGYKQIARKKKDAVAFLGYSSGDKGYAKYEGVADRYVKFTEEHQLLDKETWRRFVEVFRHDSDDFDRGWRCEFWGKMMRGGCLTYMYSGTEELALPASYVQ